MGSPTAAGQCFILLRISQQAGKKRDLKPERETGLPQGEQVAILRDPMGVPFGVMVAGE
jgi:hypothetical protein